MSLRVLFGRAESLASGRPEISFFRNRWYDHYSGRWTQEDPVGLAGGVNLYQYAGNNPAVWTDPFGLCPIEMRRDEEACRVWNRLAVESAIRILRNELRAGNPYALDLGDASVLGFSEDRISSECQRWGLREHTDYACGFRGDRLIYVNADAGAPVIATLLVHELQHWVGHREHGARARQAGELCAWARQSNFVHSMVNQQAGRVARNHPYVAENWNLNQPGCDLR